MARPRLHAAGTEPPVHHRKSERGHRRDLSGPDPVIRIGLMEEYDHILFKLIGDYDLLSLSGDTIIENLKPDMVWKIKPDQTVEARAVFSILTTAFARRDSADELRRTLSAKDYPVRVAEVGEEIYFDNKLVANNIKYRVLVGRWPTEREAKGVLDEFRDNFAPRIVRQVVKPATGTLELALTETSEKRFIEDGFRLAPKSSNSHIILYEVREGTGFHWEREVDRTYPGIIEVRLDHRALLMALSEVPLEQYLKGVVPAEMPASYPSEALKAQAIAARSEALSKIGVKHLNDPFDLCGMVHCQAYTGLTHINPASSAAVEATRGQALMSEGRVAEAVFSSCCGGHTEDKINVWNPPDAPHLHGKPDRSDSSKVKKNMNLTQEREAEKWVRNKPEAWCNTEARPDLPNILRSAAKYFRWEVKYSHRELEDIIRRKTNEDIGALLDIIPLERGVSGRLMEIEIQGTKKNLRVQRELNIRRALSPSYLYSACFTISTDNAEDGSPINFYFKGAGWGHGVGMCQVGAGVQAAEGRSCEQILTHYYPGTKIEKIYGK